MGKTLTVCLLLVLSIQPLLADSVEADASESAHSEGRGYVGVRVGYLAVQHVDSGSLNPGLHVRTLLPPDVRH